MNLKEKRFIEVKYVKKQFHDHEDEEVFSTITCYNRAECRDFAMKDFPDLRDLSTAEFLPSQYGFEIERIRNDQKIFYEIRNDHSNTTIEESLLDEESENTNETASNTNEDTPLLLWGPETVWGYDEDNLIIGAVTTKEDTSLTWTCNDEEIAQGDMVIVVQKPGKYRCIVQSGKDVIISESVEIDEMKTDTGSTSKASMSAHVVPLIELSQIDFCTQNVIGSGGFGTVYRGKWEGTEIAIKEINVPKRGREQHLRSIRQEVEIHAKLRHPCIVTLMATANTPKSVLIISELVKGCNLENGIFGDEDEKKLIAGKKDKIARQVCQAVAYMHAVDIIHQDIKPSSILVDGETGNAKICDLGIGKLKRKEATTTSRTDAPGTLMYMAPETILQKTANSYSDIWSLGCCLIELMTEQDTWDLPDDEEPHLFLTEKMKNKAKPPRLDKLQLNLARCFEYDFTASPKASFLVECFPLEA